MFVIANDILTKEKHTIHYIMSRTITMDGLTCIPLYCTIILYYHAKDYHVMLIFTIQYDKIFVMHVHIM